MILLFADDAKCYKSISTLADCAALQNETVLLNGAQNGTCF